MGEAVYLYTEKQNKNTFRATFLFSQEKAEYMLNEVVDDYIEIGYKIYKDAGTAIFLKRGNDNASIEYKRLTEFFYD